LEHSKEPRSLRAIPERDRTRHTALDEDLGNLPALFERASLDAPDLLVERYASTNFSKQVLHPMQ
jgi:hypothetical protein